MTSSTKSLWSLPWGCCDLVNNNQTRGAEQQVPTYNEDDGIVHECVGPTQQIVLLASCFTLVTEGQFKSMAFG